MTDGDWRALIRTACEPYRPAGRYAWHFARGKLAGDPVFRYLVESGLVSPQARLLDVGCGQGLLAALLRASGRQARTVGIELMAREVERARTALGTSAEIILGDMRQVPFPDADVVGILDVLHYVDPPAQDDILRRARAALPQGGLLLLRVGDARAGWRQRLSGWVDRTVCRLSGRPPMPLHFRPLDDWVRLLQDMGFTVERRPMSAGTWFANVLLVARV